MEEKMERYLAKQQLEGLVQKSTERKRLTTQLAQLVGSVADELSEIIEVGTSVQVDGVGEISIIRVKTNIDSENFLWMRTQNGSSGVVTVAIEPGKSRYWNNDFNAEVHAINKAGYLLFANNIGAIINAFEDAEDATIRSLRDGFEKLKKVAGVE